MTASHEVKRVTSRRKPSALDVFCGAGGLSEGLRQAGFRVVGAVDIDDLACRTYRLNHPSVKLWQADVSTLTGPVLLKRLKLKPGDLDLLAACPPCQGFSTMRTKNGMRTNRDPRNDLIFEVLRIARSVRPRSVMLENVPWLARSRKYREFRLSLAALGYHVKWDVLNASEYGVPQRRRRLVLLASLDGVPAFGKKAKASQTVKKAISHLSAPTKSRDPLHNYLQSHTKKVKNRIAQIPKNGGSRSALGAKARLGCHKAFAGFKDVYGRMAWNQPAPTITGGCINPSKGRFLHPTANRAISLREAALLQSFPRSYKFSLARGRYPAALLIGNALPPEFIRRHAVALRGIVREASTRD